MLLFILLLISLYAIIVALHLVIVTGVSMRTLSEAFFLHVTSAFLLAMGGYGLWIFALQVGIR